MLGKVEVEDLVGQDVGHAIARIGSQVVRLETLDRAMLPDDGGCMKAILRISRERYYRSVDMAASTVQSEAPFQTDVPAAHRMGDGDFIYETFDRPPRGS